MSGIEHHGRNLSLSAARRRNHDIGPHPDHPVAGLYRLAADRLHFGFRRIRSLQGQPDPVAWQRLKPQRKVGRRFSERQHRIGQHQFQPVGAAFLLIAWPQTKLQDIFDPFTRRPVIQRHGDHLTLLQVEQFSLGNRIGRQGS